MFELEMLYKFSYNATVKPARVVTSIKQPPA